MMNNLDKIIAKIREDADLQIAGIEAKCEKEMASLTSRTENAIDKMDTEAMLRSKKEGDAILARANAASSMAKREILLSKKAALLDEVYRRAEKAIYGLSDSEYTAFLAKLTADAVMERTETVRNLTEMYDEEDAAEHSDVFTVVFSPYDREKYGKKVLTAARSMLNKRMEAPPKLMLSSENADIPGGVVLRYGDMETCCSVPALIAGVREKTETKIAALLFG